MTEKAKIDCPLCQDSSGKPTGKVAGLKCRLCKGKKYILK